MARSWKEEYVSTLTKSRNMMAWQRNFSDGGLIILDENNVLQSY